MCGAVELILWKSCRLQQHTKTSPVHLICVRVCVWAEMCIGSIMNVNQMKVSWEDVTVLYEIFVCLSVRFVVTSTFLCTFCPLWRPNLSDRTRARKKKRTTSRASHSIYISQGCLVSHPNKNMSGRWCDLDKYEICTRTLTVTVRQNRPNSQMSQTVREGKKKPIDWLCSCGCVCECAANGFH